MRDGTIYQVRIGEGGTADVPEAVALELTSKHGFTEVLLPLMTDEELDALRARRDELKTRLNGLEAEETAVTVDGAAASARFESAKESLASGDGTLDRVREAEREVEETRSRSVLIAEAASSVRTELCDVAQRFSGEESLRDVVRQNAEAEPLLEEAAAEVAAFVEAAVAAQASLVSRAAILDKIRTDYPRVNVPALKVADLGSALQAALADSAIERQAVASASFAKLAEMLIVGPLYRPDSPEALARLDAVKVTR
jgi:hypothetical protein